MIGIMFVLTITAFFWLYIFGGNAIYMELRATSGVGRWV
jgi:choline/glycine/proline betaine transport protein